MSDQFPKQNKEYKRNNGVYEQSKHEEKQHYKGIHRITWVTVYSGVARMKTKSRQTLPCLPFKVGRLNSARESGRAL